MSQKKDAISVVKKSVFCDCEDNRMDNSYLLGNNIGQPIDSVLYWGENNDLPEQLFISYTKNVYFGRIINTTADFIIGGGLELNPDTEKYIQSNMALDIKRKDRNSFNRERMKDAVNVKCDTLEDVVKMQIRDLLLFGTYSADLYFGHFARNLSEIYYMDVIKNRFLAGKTKVRHYFNNWVGGGYGKRIDLPLFNAYNNIHDRAIFMHYNENERTVYPLPHYFSGLDNIDVDTDITKYNKNTLKNGFSSFTIVMVPNSASDDELQKLVDNMKKHHTGASGEKIVFIKDDGSGNTANIFSAPQEDIDTRFVNLEQSSERRVFTAFNAPKILFGNYYEGNGFSQQEYYDVYRLYMNNVVEPFRQKIYSDYEYILGIEQPFIFKKSALEREAFKPTE